MKLRNVSKESIIQFTLERWSLNVEKLDSENLKRGGTIEREKKIG